MNTQHLIRLVASVAGIIGFFLSFFNLGFQPLSGFQIFKGIFDGGGLFRLFEMSRINNVEDALGLGGLFIVMIGPLIFMVYFLIHLLRALMKSDFRGGLVWSIFYVLVAVAFVTVLGQKSGYSVSFFDFVGVGFWLSIVALPVASLADRLVGR